MRRSHGRWGLRCCPTERCCSATTAAGRSTASPTPARNRVRATPRCASRLRGPMEAQASKKDGVALAMERPELAAQRGAMSGPTSGSFDEGQSIPVRHSEYGEGVSPAPRWYAVEGAVSYIPGDATTLAEALPAAPRLTDPGSAPRPQQLWRDGVLRPQAAAGYRHAPLSLPAVRARHPARRHAGQRSRHPDRGDARPRDRARTSDRQVCRAICALIDVCGR